MNQYTRIVAHSPTLVSSGLLPHRVVLVAKTLENGEVNEFVVWVQTFDQQTKEHLGFHSGHYFPTRSGKAYAIHQAFAKFKERSDLYMQNVFNSTVVV